LIKTDRVTLIDRIAKAAKLTRGQELAGYFNKRQLTELVLFIETQNKTIGNLKAAFEEINDEKCEQPGKETSRN